MKKTDVFSLLVDKLTPEELKETIKVIKEQPEIIIEPYEARQEKEKQDLTDSINQKINEVAYEICHHIKKSVDNKRESNDSGEHIEFVTDIMDAEGIAEALSDYTAKEIYEVIVKLAEIDFNDEFAELMHQVFVSLEFDYEYPNLEEIYKFIRNAPKNTFTENQLDCLLEEF